MTTYNVTFYLGDKKIENPANRPMNETTLLWHADLVIINETAYQVTQLAYTTVGEGANCEHAVAITLVPWSGKLPSMDSIRSVLEKAE